jgi:hypothetical protein
VEGPNTFIEGPGAPPGTSRAIATDVPITLESIKLMDLFRKEVHFHLSPLADKLGIEAAKIAQEKYAHSIDIQHHANGGLIYANDGKYINFKPKGTDTVPAMLTPGEFVVNAKSTKNNLSLLKSINNGQNPDYFQNGGMIGSYGAGGNSGGGRPSQSGVLDIESLNSAFDNFSRSVDSLKSVIDSFVQTGNKISSAFGQLNSIESGAAKLSVAAASINSASNNFNNTINGFNTSLRSLERAISRIPSNISLNINGSIPVNVTVEMNGEAVQQDMPQLRDEVIGAVENAIRDAMPGININIRR